MNDIFLSYASADRATAKKFADALESLGWSVWWDREIPVGKNFDRIIEEELNAAGCAVVLWSQESVRSRWVRTEASSAAAKDRLIPVLIDPVPVPLEFTLIQAAQLSEWDGDTNHPEFRRLVDAIQQILGKSAVCRDEPPPPIGTRKRSLPSLPIVIALVAIFVVVLVLGRTFLNRTDTQPPQQSQVATSTTNGATAIDATSGNTAQTRPPEGALQIKIGGKISEGVPGPGAGVIETPYGKDVYVFTAARGQLVYFRMQRHGNGMDQVRWQLVDEQGTELFNTCLACTEAGLQSLAKGGTYTLTVGGNNASTGSYQLQLFDVPPPNRFSVKVGDRIADNMPGEGAANIEVPGAQDIYTFTVSSRQRVYFRMFQHSTGMDQIRWQLTDANSMEMFNTCLACTEAGLQVLEPGTYTLTIGNKTNPATGRYSLQLFNVPPPQEFSIKIGDRIRSGMPGPGAGAIEIPGAEDVYRFTATAVQKIYVRVLEHAAGTDQIRLRLVDDSGMELFNTCLACSEPGAQTLTRGGVYTLTVGNNTNPSTGTYGLEIGLR